MLVLGRRSGERIMIGDEIVLTILAVDGDRVKLGIEAPATVRILRHELFETVKAENIRAAKAPRPATADLLPSLQRLLAASQQKRN